MKTIFLVRDTNTDEIVGANLTYDGARATLSAHLEEVGYCTDEWLEFAEYNGFETIDDFKAAIRQRNDYDSDMMMDIEEVEMGE